MSIGEGPGAVTRLARHVEAPPSLEETTMTIQRAVADYTYRTPPHLRDCDVLTGHIVRALKNSAAERRPISAEEKRWRFFEHGCQSVSWTPTGGETVSFDPRDLAHLQAMRESADKTLHEQVAQLHAEADALERKLKK